MLTYATEDDLVDFDGDLDIDARVTRYLRVASGVVGFAVRFDLYDAAPSGLPSDPEALEALRDATCAQVAHWILNDIDPGTVGASQAAPRVKSKAEGTRNITYTDDDPGVAAARVRSAEDLCHDAAVILQAAGFLTGKPGRY